MVQFKGTIVETQNQFRITNWAICQLNSFEQWLSTFYGYKFRRVKNHRKSYQ